LATNRPPDGPIFLLGSHKSGSSLLRGLLDDHPRLFVLPTEIHFFQYTGFWVDYRLRRALPRAMDRVQKIEALTELVRKTNEHEDPYADSVTAGLYDVERFRRSLESSRFQSPRELFDAYVHALHVSLTGAKLPAAVRVVEKSVENTEHAVTLRHMFPDCSFVHIVRNPYASLVALRKSRPGPGYPSLRAGACSLQNTYYNLYRNEGVLDRYMTVRYEDLVTQNAATMERIAEFLEVEFLEVLLRPTLMGKPWGGNSTGGKGFSGVSAAPLEHWKREVNDLEIHLVNRMLAHVLDRFGYERMVPRRSAVLPVKGEKPSTWLRNRILLRWV